MAADGTGAVVTPAAPSSLSARAAGSGTVELGWTDNSDNEASFRVEYRPASNAAWILLGTTPPNTTTFSQTGLSAGASYHYRVTACNQGGCSPPCPEASVTLAGAGPAAPSDLRAEAVGFGRSDLRWTDNSGDETGFWIDFRIAPDTLWARLDSLPPNTTAFSHTGLADGATYVYRLKACNRDGCSPAAGEPGVVVLGAGPVTIGPAGGIAVAPGGRVRVSIPAGALSAPVIVSLSPAAPGRPPDVLPGTSVSAVWEAYPAGAKFLQPVQVQWRYDDEPAAVAAGAQLGVAHWDESGYVAEIVTAENDRTRAVISFETSEFSRFVLRHLPTPGTPGWQTFQVKWVVPDLTWYIRPPGRPSYLTAATVRAAFAQWQGTGAAIRFHQAATESEAQIVFQEALEVVCDRWGVLDVSGVAVGRACFPTLAASARVLDEQDKVVVKINSTHLTAATAFKTIRHEIGHALGLAHPFVLYHYRNCGGGLGNDYCPVMAQGGFERSSLHGWDVAAVRFQYGVPVRVVDVRFGPEDTIRVLQNNPALGSEYHPVRGYGSRFRFDWDDIEGAPRYELLAHIDSAVHPFVHVTSTVSEYPWTCANCFVVGHPPALARWKVQPVYDDTTYGPWSAERVLEFTRCLLNDSTPCGSPHVRVIIPPGRGTSNPYFVVLDIDHRNPRVVAITNPDGVVDIHWRGERTVTLGGVNPDCFVVGGRTKNIDMPVDYFNYPTVRFEVRC
ncbi:MAG TPA: fibronectin type III domain-containing protein [Longimicrobium sp.]